VFPFRTALLLHFRAKKMCKNISLYSKKMSIFAAQKTGLPVLSYQIVLERIKDKSLI
jgi:hypothetical protein